MQACKQGENGTMPSWSDLGARIAQEQRQGNAQRRWPAFSAKLGRRTENRFRIFFAPAQLRSKGPGEGDEQTSSKPSKPNKTN